MLAPDNCYWTFLLIMQLLCYVAASLPQWTLIDKGREQQVQGNWEMSLTSKFSDLIYVQKNEVIWGRDMIC